MTINIENRNELGEKILNNQLNLKKNENNFYPLFRIINEYKTFKSFRK